MEAQKFGVRLKQLRKQAGMTQRELANKVGVDFTYLSKIESGAMPPPSQKVILQLAEALNADKDELTILAGKIPSDIAKILGNQETLQHLRSAHARQMARASRKRGGTIDTMKRLMSYNKRLSKIAIPVALVLAVAASLWFVSPTPVRALEISFPTLPSGSLGTTHSFSITVDIGSTEIVPIQSIDMEIYNVADTTKKATCSNLPLTDGGTATYSNTDTGGGGTVSVTATAPTWAYFSGTGYAYWKGTGYSFGQVTGYGYQTGAAAITYAVTWTSPSSGWPAGGYEVEVSITATSSTRTETFTETSSEFTLSGPTAAVEGGGGDRPSAEEGVTDVSDVVTSEGEFTEAVTTESEDGNVELTIDEGTIGLIEEEPLSEISVTEMEDPPAPPADSNVIGLAYDLGPDDATFDPPITLTFTYDPALIPEGVAEENLVITIWDEAAGEWVNLVSTVDPVTNTITASVSHFTAFTVVAYTRPAVFTATDLAIAPEEVDIGEKVTVSALVTNTGDLADSYKITLKIDGVAVATQDVTLAGGASQKVTFTTTKDAAGTYTVNINGLSSTFTVREVAPPPVVPPPVVPPPVVPPPVVPPPVVPPVPSPFPWWWIVAGVVVVGLLVYLLVVRRRRA